MLCTQGGDAALTTVPLPSSTPLNNRANSVAVLLHTVRVLLMDMLAADMASTLLRFCSSALSAARHRERAKARLQAQQAAAAAAAAAAVESKGGAQKRRRGAAAAAADTAAAAASDSAAAAAGGEDSKPASATGSSSTASCTATATTAAAASDNATDDDADTDTAAELTGLAAEEARERARAAAAFFGLDKLNARALAHLFTAAGRGLSAAEAAALAWHGLNAGLSFDDLPEPPAWSGQLLQLACSKSLKRERNSRNGSGVQAASS
jgi:hypothetical protein